MNSTWQMKKNTLDRINVMDEEHIMTEKNDSTDGALTQFVIRSYHGHWWEKMSAQMSDGDWAEWPACFFRTSWYRVNQIEKYPHEFGQARQNDDWNYCMYKLNMFKL